MGVLNPNLPLSCTPIWTLRCDRLSVAWVPVCTLCTLPSSLETFGHTYPSLNSVPQIPVTIWYQNKPEDTLPYRNIDINMSNLTGYWSVRLQTCSFDVCVKAKRDIGPILFASSSLIQKLSESVLSFILTLFWSSTIRRAIFSKCQMSCKFDPIL